MRKERSRMIKDKNQQTYRDPSIRLLCPINRATAGRKDNFNPAARAFINDENA